MCDIILIVALKKINEVIMNRKRLFIIFIAIICGISLYAEAIDDIYDVVKKDSKIEFISYLEGKGLEQYNTRETNGNTYFQPKSGRRITFYDMEIMNIIFLYNKNDSSFEQVSVVVKNIGNETKARKAKNFLVNKFQLNNTTDPDYYKNDSYSFMFYEYPDISYGYIRFTFSKRFSLQ